MFSFLFTAFGFLRNSWVGKVAIIAGGALVALLLAYSAGERGREKQQKIKNLEEYIDVRERADKTADQTLRDLDGISDVDLTSRLRKHRALRD